MIITLQEGDKFLVTGRYYNSTRKFRMLLSSWQQANCINLWNGNVWLVRDGHRKLVKSVRN